MGCNSGLRGVSLPAFLPLMEEKQQKKIKASPRPGMLAGYLTNFLASVELAGMSTNRYQANFSASEEASVRPTDRCTFARLTRIINTENETLHCGEAERGSGDCACAGGEHAARWVL